MAPLRPELRPCLDLRLLELGTVASRSGSETVSSSGELASLGELGTSASFDWELLKVCSVPSSYELPSSPRLLLESLQEFLPLMASIVSTKI